MDAKLLNAIKGTPAPAAKLDRLEAARNMARAMRDLKMEIVDAEARLNERKTLLYNISTKDLPDLLAEVKLKGITLEAEGNMPAYELESLPYYKAVLPKDPETDEPLPEGLNWLEKKGHGDIIKRVFTVYLPMDSKKSADALRKFLNGPIKKTKKKQPHKPRFEFEEKRTVPWATLTAFVKEQIEKRQASLPLETLGAVVGRIIKMKLSKTT